MKTWIHILTKVEDDTAVMIPDTEMMIDWREGDPAGYQSDKKNYKDWFPVKVKIPEELHPSKTSLDEIILMPEGPAERRIFLRDVLAADENGRPCVKIGENEYKLEEVIK